MDDPSKETTTSDTREELVAKALDRTQRLQAMLAQHWDDAVDRFGLDTVHAIRDGIDETLAYLQFGQKCLEAQERIDVIGEEAYIKELFERAAAAMPD